MFQFSVWVDADSFPRTARDFVENYAFSKTVQVKFVANREIKTKNQNTKMIICEKGANSADNYIFDNAAPNDIVLTRDLPFAARLVEKKICVMNDRGLIFNSENIEEKLREREFSLNLSAIGLGGNRENYYGEKELKKFSRTFEEKIQEHIMIEIYGIKQR